MRSKILFLTTAVTAVLLSACAGYQEDRSQDNIIGEKLTEQSSLTDEHGSDKPKVALYDYTVGLIHQFDLTTGKLDRTLFPVYPGGTHYVLFDTNGNYVIDLTTKHLTIFDNVGAAHDVGLGFIDTPISASFKPSLRYLVVYGDHQSVLLMKLDANGNVMSKAVRGPIISSNVTIAAGDIDDQGRLILALSDSSIVIVDIDQTIASATGDWVYSAPFTTALTDINWIAPVHDQPNQILAKSKTSGNIALIDLAAKAVIGSPISIGKNRVMKSSKSYDPHILVDRGDGKVDMIYAQGGALQTRSTQAQVNYPLSSRLNLASDSWTIVDASEPALRVGLGYRGYFWYDDPNSMKTKRRLKKYSKQGLSVADFALPDGAQLQLTETHVFELYDNKLGYAVNCTLDGACAEPFPNFNYPYLHKK